MSKSKQDSTQRNGDPLEDARYVFKSIRAIRERALRIHVRDFAEAAREGGYEDLSVAQMQAVLVVRELGKTTIKNLAAILGVSPPSASTMVDRLVEKGVLTREQSTEDRRKVEVDVSPRAEKGMEKVEERMLNSFVELVRELGPEKSGQWREVLDSVLAAIDKLVNQEPAR
ncbi:MAG: MarR family winged helix-turn-helix transcriptional regulator [Desulfatibacillaceae bacterium]